MKYTGWDEPRQELVRVMLSLQGFMLIHFVWTHTARRCRQDDASDTTYHRRLLQFCDSKVLGARGWKNGGGGGGGGDMMGGLIGCRGPAPRACRKRSGWKTPIGVGANGPNGVAGDRGDP
jgi:hypothetical protein